MQIRPAYATALINQSVRQIMGRGWTLSGSEIEQIMKKDVIEIAANIVKTVSMFILYL